jgi:hypothetical protein
MLALHADKKLKELGKQGRIIIKTSDTDVIVLCIYFVKQMTNTSELWVRMGNVSSVKDGRRFLPIHELCSSLSIGEGRGGFARQEACQTLVWNEARRIC